MVLTQNGDESTNPNPPPRAALGCSVRMPPWETPWLLRSSFVTLTIKARSPPALRLVSCRSDVAADPTREESPDADDGRDRGATSAPRPLEPTEFVAEHVLFVFHVGTYMCFLG